MRGKRIRVAIIAPGEVYGGVERFVNVLAECFNDDQEVQPLVILFHDTVQAELLRKSGVEVVIPQQRGKYDLSLAGKLAGLFKRKGIDIVHTNGYKATILGAIAAKYVGIPVVKTEHGKLEPGLCIDPRHLRMRVNRFLDEIVTRLFVHHVVYVSHDLQSMFRRNNDREKSSIIYNGINPIQISQRVRPPEIDSTFFNIGMIGRLTTVKGHRVLLNALTQLHDLKDLRVHIIGEGSLEKDLRKFCQRHGLNGTVQFLNFKQNIYDYISSLDLLVMPSVHEGLPYVLLESMYLKIPIIASEVGGLNEILQNNIDALLVKPGDERSLAEAIRSLHTCHALRKILSENAFQKVQKDFMVTTMAREYTELYYGRLGRLNDRSPEVGCSAEILARTERQ